MKMDKNGDFIAASAGICIRNGFFPQLRRAGGASPVSWRKVAVRAPFPDGRRQEILVSGRTAVCRLQVDQAAADLPVGKVKVVLEESVDLTLLRIGHAIKGLAAIAGQDFLVDKSTDIEVLHPVAAEVPPGFVVKKLSDAFFVEPGLDVSKCDGLAGFVLALLLQPSFVSQAIHLIQKVSGRDIKLFYLAEFHEGTAKEYPILVHYVGVRKIGIAWKESGDFFPVGEYGGFGNDAPVFGEQLIDGTIRISEGGCGRAMMQTIPEDVVGENELMIESIDLQNIGTLLAETAGSTVFPVEVTGIGHPGPSGKYRGAVGKGVDVDMGRHFGV